MPLRDDLLERSLEQLAAALRALLGSQSASEGPALEALIERSYREHTGSSALALRLLPSADLLRVLSSAGVLDREKAYLIAALSEAEAALEAARGEGDGAEFRLRALDLLLEVALAGLERPELPAQIERLEAELAAYALPLATEGRLLAYAQQRGDFAGGEDRLFALLERAELEREVEELGRAFYGALLVLPDAQLEEGGLPRAEVEEGRAAFEAQLERTLD